MTFSSNEKVNAEGATAVQYDALLSYFDKKERSCHLGKNLQARHMA
jgi:hypothetical protein